MLDMLRLSRAQADRERQFFRRGGPLGFELNGQSFKLIPVLPESGPSDAQIGLSMSIGNRKALAVMDERLLDLLCRAAVPDLVTAGLDEESRVFLLDHLFSPLISSLETALAVPIDINEIVAADAPDGLEALHFRLEPDGASVDFPLALFASRSALEMIASALARRQLELAPADCLALEVAIVLGRADLSRRELWQLEPGDILLLGRTRLGDDIVSLVVQDRLSIAAALKDGSIVALGEGAVFMSDEAAADIAIEDIDELPVQVVFELGRMTMSVAELRMLAKGQSLELDRDLQSPVDLKVNGRLIGRGELVQIENRLGVRIREYLDRAAT